MSRRVKVVPAPLPVVNLLSESEFQRMAVRRLRLRFLAGGVALLLLIGAAWTVQHVRVDEARKLVAVEQAETDRLTAQTQVLAPVRAYINGVAVQQRSVGAAMVNEIYFSRVLDGVQDATPVGAQLGTLAVTLAPTGDAAAAAVTGASPCPGPDPFNTRTIVGCVTLAGTAETRDEVGDMVIALGDSKLFVEPFINTTTTADDTGVTFSGSVGLSEKVYSGRFGDPAPSASPSTQPGQPAGSAAASAARPADGSVS